MSVSIDKHLYFPHDPDQSYKKSEKDPSYLEYDTQDPSEILSTRPSSDQSSFLAYQQLISDFPQSRQIHQLALQLKQQGISYDQNYSPDRKALHFKNSENSLRILTMKHTKHYQILTFQVSLGPFTQEMIIYHTFQDTIFTLSQTYSRQEFNICPFKYNLNDYIIKSTKLSTNDKEKNYLNKEKILSMLKECFLGKVLSALKIGPKVPSDFGFDVFVSKSYCFFIMEPCLPTINREFTQQDGEILKKNMKEMHDLSIVHRDIKPDNIMYSPSFKKFVFIDFGVSESIPQSPSQLVYTSFAGTYRYSSKDMRSLFENHSNGWVNLHLNDVFGLQMSINEIQQQFETASSFSSIEENKKINNKAHQSLEFTLFLTQVRTKHFLLSKKANLVKEMREEILIFPEEIVPSIMNFLYEIPLTQNIRLFYREFLREKIQEEPGFEDLKQIFSHQIFYEFCQGRRNLSSKEKEAIQDVKLFYSQVQSKFCPSDQFRNLTIKTLESVIFANYLKKEIQDNLYERYLINYLNLKRMAPTIPIKKKLQACQKYIEIKELAFEKKEDLDNPRIALEFVFRHILQKISVDAKIMYFNEYLRGLENYFLITENLKIEILDEMNEVIQGIESSKQLSFLEKTEFTLSLLYAINCIRLKCFKVKIYQKVVFLTKLIKQKMSFYVAQAKSEGSLDFQLCEFYQSCLDEFEYEFLLSNCVPETQLQKISRKIPQSSHSSVLLSYLQYTAIRKIERSDDVRFQLKQKEEMLFEEMSEDKEFNTNLIKLIFIYYANKEVARLKKLFSIYDSCVQIEDLMDFPFVRLMIFACSQKDCEDLKSHKRYDFEKIQKQIVDLFEFKEDEDLMVFELTNRAYNFFTLRTREERSLISGLRSQAINGISKNISRAIQTYERLNPEVEYRGSTKFFYLDLLLRDVQSNQKADSKRIFEDEQYYFEVLAQYKDIESFKKLVALDRTNFIHLDDVSMLYVDVFNLKFTHGKSASTEILKYFLTKKPLFIQVFKSKTAFEKGDIMNFCNTVLRLLIVENDLQKLAFFLDQIYPIVSKSYIVDNFMIEFSNPFIVALIKTSKFKELIFEITYTSIFYSKHFSNASFATAIKTWKLIMKRLQKFGNLKLFYFNLKEAIKGFDFKKYFTFNVFLLFCIQPFNRMAILKIVLKNLSSLKFITKHLVLSRFYKELLKLNRPEFVKKRKMLLKKDVGYPSQYTKTLDDMKKQLDPVKSLQFFVGIFKDKIENKLIKLGNCCEVYSNKKLVDPSNQLIEHEVLDGGSLKREQIWQGQDW